MRLTRACGTLRVLSGTMRPAPAIHSGDVCGTLCGMSDPHSDFRLYHSNSLDVLAALLARHLRHPMPGQPLLAPETILIPQVAMRRWLQ